MHVLLVSLFLCVTPYYSWDEFEITYAYQQFDDAIEFWNSQGLGYLVKSGGVLPLDCTEIEGLPSIPQIRILRGMDLPEYSVVYVKGSDYDGYAGLAYVGGPVALVKWTDVAPSVVRHEIAHLFGALDCVDDDHDCMCWWGSNWVSDATLQRMRLWLGQMKGYDD